MWFLNDNPTNYPKNKGHKRHCIVGSHGNKFKQNLHPLTKSKWLASVRQEESNKNKAMLGGALV